MGAFWLSSLLLFSGFTCQVEEPDSVRLKELTVNASPTAVNILRGGNLRVDTERLRRGSRVMGEADIVNILKRSGGITSSSDYSSGLSIRGDDASHTMFRIDNAPVFYPYRFGGVFSTFNTTHFTSATIFQANRGASSPSRLGAVIDLAPRLDYNNAIGGNINVGLLASTLTIRSALHRKFALTVSGRISYIDEVYGRVIKNNTNTIEYRFSDVNVSAGWRLDSLNSITANYFRNGDNLSSGNANYAMNTGLKWHNNVGSISWRGKRSTMVTTYVSEFGSNLTVALPQNDVLSRSGIIAYGATGQTEIAGWDKCSLVGGLDASGMKITPLWAYMQGAGSHVSAPEQIQKCWELRAFADVKIQPNPGLTIVAGLSASTFGGRFFDFDPRASVEWRYGENLWNFGAGVFSQYLHQVGFSDIGLASNFWYGSIDKVKPQRSVDLTVGWQRRVLNDELIVSATVYFKRVVSQSEYQGQVLDIITSDYEAQRNMLISNGYNCGAIVGIQKRFGLLTGQLNYTYGYAIRRHGDVWFRSITDTGHQFKADIDYEINSHWSVGAAFIFSSGRVYTPTRYLYVISNRIMAQYGKRNSSRFPPYQHLDLSATYSTGHHSVNLSIINVYGYRNVEIQYFDVNSHSGHYELYHQYSLYRFLPSISYSFDF